MHTIRYGKCTVPENSKNSGSRPPFPETTSRLKSWSKNLAELLLNGSTMKYWHQARYQNRNLIKWHCNKQNKVGSTLTKARAKLFNQEAINNVFFCSLPFQFVSEGVPDSLCGAKNCTRWDLWDRINFESVELFHLTWIDKFVALRSNEIVLDQSDPHPLNDFNPSS